MADAQTERRIAELLRDERLAEAAELLAKRGEHARAAGLFERGCAFDRAAEEALASGDARRAFELATRDGESGLALDRAIEALAADPGRAERAARDALDRDRARGAALLFARIGEHAEAGAAFERAGDDKSAAESFIRAGDALGAARALERAIALDETDHAAKLRLGALLAEHGRAEAAVRTLQRIPPAAKERGDALALLVGALGALGLEAAREEALRELGALGRSAATTPVAREPSPTAAGPVLFGRWSWVREVVVTPTARVLEAIDRTTGERVAVKLLAAGAVAGAGRDAVARFEREARALGELRHPNVVPLRAYVPEGPALVLAWMSGGSLADRERRETLAPARALEIACAVLEALGAAHRLGIVHRDVKPSNVLFDDAGVARLSDFGAAHVGDAAATATAGVIGTLAYMAPEQREGRAATIASDLYAAGAILTELLTGRPPAASSPNVRLAAAHPGLGPEHEAALARLCARDPRGRPADASEAIRLLRAMPWPATAVSRERPKAVPPAAAPRVERLVSIDATRAHDAWLDRDVLLVPLDDRSLARARAFARAGHPALAAVLRVDRDAATIWIEPPRAPSLAATGADLSPAAVAALSQAVDALHVAGGVHGAIDPAHVHLDGDAVTLAFAADAPGDATEASDREALAQLSA